MSAHGTFCTVFDCMDGRCQEQVGAWARKEFGVEFPDTITIAGPDGVLRGDEREFSRAMAMGKISVEKHGSTCAVLVGHTGCAGYPVSEGEHKKAVKDSVEKIAKEGVFETVVGLYMDVDKKTLEEVCRI